MWFLSRKHLLEASADNENEVTTIEGDQTSLGVAFILRDVDICPPGSDKPLVTGKYQGGE